MKQLHHLHLIYTCYHVYRPCDLSFHWDFRKINKERWFYNSILLAKYTFKLLISCFLAMVLIHKSLSSWTDFSPSSIPLVETFAGSYEQSGWERYGFFQALWGKDFRNKIKTVFRVKYIAHLSSNMHTDHFRHACFLSSNIWGKLKGNKWQYSDEQCLVLFLFSSSCLISLNPV